MHAPLKSLMPASLFGIILTLALCPGGTATAGEISRALFTTAIDNREPVAIIESLDGSTSNSISFLTFRISILNPVKCRECDAHHILFFC